MNKQEEKNFDLIARMWTNYLDIPGVTINAQDVASMMVILKIARARNGSGSKTFKDASWYAESAAEICEKIESQNSVDTQNIYDGNHNLVATIPVIESEMKFTDNGCDKCRWYHTKDPRCGRCGPYANQFQPKDIDCTGCIQNECTDCVTCGNYKALSFYETQEQNKLKSEETK